MTFTKKRIKSNYGYVDVESYFKNAPQSAHTFNVTSVSGMMGNFHQISLLAEYATEIFQCISEEISSTNVKLSTMTDRVTDVANLVSSSQQQQHDEPHVAPSKETSLTSPPLEPVNLPSHISCTEQVVATVRTDESPNRHLRGHRGEDKNVIECDCCQESIQSVHHHVQPSITPFVQTGNSTLNEVLNNNSCAEQVVWTARASESPIRRHAEHENENGLKGHDSTKSDHQQNYKPIISTTIIQKRKGTLKGDLLDSISVGVILKPLHPLPSKPPAGE